MKIDPCRDFMFAYPKTLLAGRNPARRGLKTGLSGPYDAIEMGSIR
jgi:hypothetical protein